MRGGHTSYTRSVAREEWEKLRRAERRRRRARESRNDRTLPVAPGTHAAVASLEERAQVG